MKRIDLFKTNVENREQAAQLKAALVAMMPETLIHIDVDDCDKILRLENNDLDAAAVIRLVENAGFTCKILPDKMCDKPTNTAADMERFWDMSFIEHQAMWGFEPTVSARMAKDYFVKEGVKTVLVPGIGYGRNAQVFSAEGMKVSGIEISEQAIAIAAKHYGKELKIYQGSVTDMPFDKEVYDAVFCYGLLYLLNPRQRKKFLKDCFQQLAAGGTLVFSVLSKYSPNYGKGKKIDVDTFEIGQGAQLFFYDEEAIRLEFAPYGLVDYTEIGEQTNAQSNQVAFKFWLITCKKPL